MSVPVSSPGKQVAVPRHPTTARTGAAKRAYDKRQQRAQSHSRTGSPVVRSTGAIAARIPFVACIIGLLSIGLALTLLLTTRSAEDSYQLSAARAHNQDLSEQAAALQRDVETANSAPELAKRAKQLGMIPTKDVARLLVGLDGGVQVVGTPAPATGAPAPDFDAAPPIAATTVGTGGSTATPGSTGTPGSTATRSTTPATPGSEALTPMTNGQTPAVQAAPTRAAAAQAPAAQAPIAQALVAQAPVAQAPAVQSPAAPAPPAGATSEQQVAVQPEGAR